VTLRRIGWPARACPGVINNFNALGERTKQDILNFLRSL